MPQLCARPSSPHTRAVSRSSSFGLLCGIAIGLLINIDSSSARALFPGHGLVAHAHLDATVLPKWIVRFPEHIQKRLLGYRPGHRLRPPGTTVPPIADLNYPSFEGAESFVPVPPSMIESVPMPPSEFPESVIPSLGAEPPSVTEPVFMPPSVFPESAIMESAEIPAVISAEPGPTVEELTVGDIASHIPSLPRYPEPVIAPEETSVISGAGETLLPSSAESVGPMEEGLPLAPVEPGSALPMESGTAPISSEVSELAATPTVVEGTPATVCDEGGCAAVVPAEETVVESPVTVSMPETEIISAEEPSTPITEGL